MRVALNLLYLRPRRVGGTETYAAGLLAGLSEIAGEDHFLVLLNRLAADWPLPASANFERIICPVGGRRQSSRYLYEQARLPALLRRQAVDVVHSLGYVSPLITHCPRVVTIHDVNYIAFGAQMPTLQRLALRTFVPMSGRRAHGVLTPSAFSRDQIVEHLAVLPSGIAITPYAKPASSDAVRCAFNRAKAWRPCEAPYLIAFGSTSRNKNLDRLIEAVQQITPAPRLVIVGHVAPDIRALSLRAGVVLTGHLELSRLHDALLGSDALIFPSLYEGFGLPVLEAMALGVPVVCSNVASLPEIAGDAAVYFNPRDVAEMRARIVEVISDPPLRASLRLKGIARAAHFTWRNTAARTLEVYRHVVAERRAHHG